MPEEQSPQEPQFKADAMRGMIAQAVVAGIQGVQQANVERQRAVQAERASHEAVSTDPVGATVLGSPVMRDVLREMATENALTRDYADFYGDHPDAREFKGDIEKWLDATRRSGNPWNREAVWAAYPGKNQEVFVERAIRQRENPNLGINANGSALGRADAPAVINFGPDTPLDDMRKLLEGRTF